MTCKSHFALLKNFKISNLAKRYLNFSLHRTNLKAFYLFRVIIVFFLITDIIQELKFVTLRLQAAIKTLYNNEFKVNICFYSAPS